MVSQYCSFAFSCLMQVNIFKTLDLMQDAKKVSFTACHLGKL